MGEGIEARNAFLDENSGTKITLYRYPVLPGWPWFGRICRLSGGWRGVSLLPFIRRSGRADYLLGFVVVNH